MKIIISIIIMTITIGVCQSQTNRGIIIYKKEKLQYQTQSEKGEELRVKNPMVYRNAQTIENNVKLLLEDIRFELRFNNGTSIFKVRDVLESDRNKYYGFAVGLYESGIYYINLEKKENYTQLDSYGETFLIRSPNKLWNLSNQTKKIDKYICFKAETMETVKGRNGIINIPVTAWYASEIGVSHGPMGFGGLPGLILELNIGNDKFIVDKIDFSPKNKFVIQELSKGKKVTKDEFEEIGLKLIKDYQKF